MDFPIPPTPRLFGPSRLLDFRKISHPPTIWTPRLLGTKEYGRDVWTVEKKNGLSVLPLDPSWIYKHFTSWICLVYSKVMFDRWQNSTNLSVLLPVNEIYKKKFNG